MEFLRSDNGQNSMSRLMIFVIVLWKLAEGTALMATNLVRNAPAIVPAIPDMPLQWAGVVGILYGLNKFGTKGAADVANVPDKIEST